eukprot:GHVH01001069.1.p1 GENE.GHVH01001069.1~~GHVH01001069.1.p1  ORF type:complete len:160 (+),score=21.23 GHVH01001069.1:25-480(+)
MATTLTERVKAATGESDLPLDFDALRGFTRDEVETEGASGRVIFIIRHLVYDCTEYKDHPGGYDYLESVAGEDATDQFESISHSKAAMELSKKYLIGYVIGEENDAINHILGKGPEETKGASSTLTSGAAMGPIIAVVVMILMVVYYCVIA